MPRGRNHDETALIVAHLVVVAIGFVSATILAYAGKLDSSAFTVIVGVLVGLVGGGAVLGHGAAIGTASPHNADRIIADQAAPLPGGRRNYDPPPNGHPLPPDALTPPPAA